MPRPLVWVHALPGRSQASAVPGGTRKPRVSPDPSCSTGPTPPARLAARRMMSTASRPCRVGTVTRSGASAGTTTAATATVTTPGAAATAGTGVAPEDAGAVFIPVLSMPPSTKGTPPRSAYERGGSQLTPRMGSTRQNVNGCGGKTLQRMAVHGGSGVRYPFCSQTPHESPAAGGTFMRAGPGSIPRYRRCVPCQRGHVHGGVPPLTQSDVPAAARAALPGRVRSHGAPGREGDRRNGFLRRPLHRPGRVRRDPLPQLRVRAGLPPHVPRPDPGRSGLLPARGGARPVGAAHRPLHPQGERRAASRVHGGRLRDRGGRDDRPPPARRHPSAALPGRRVRGGGGRGGRTPDPAAGRPARGRRPVPQGCRTPARRVRAAGRGSRPAVHRGPVARGRR